MTNVSVHNLNVTNLEKQEFEVMWRNGLKKMHLGWFFSVTN